MADNIRLDKSTLEIFEWRRNEQLKDNRIIKALNSLMVLQATVGLAAALAFYNVQPGLKPTKITDEEVKN
jgi:hypothetical protein